MDLFLDLQKLDDNIKKMKKQQYYTYLSQLLAGLKSRKRFFIAKNTKASKQLSQIFMQLGILNCVTETNPQMFSKNIKKNTQTKNYLAFWFKKNFKSNDNKIHLTHHRFTKNTLSFHKIQIIGKTSFYHKHKISYKKLLQYYPYWNTIYILSTPKGIITSKEALEQKVGGHILCKIIL